MTSREARGSSGKARSTKPGAATKKKIDSAADTVKDVMGLKL